MKQNFYKELICDIVKSKYYFIKWVILHNMNINIITIVKNFYNKYGLIFLGFPNRAQLYIYTELSLHEAQEGTA